MDSWALLEPLCAIARRAGDLILEHYPGGCAVREKGDASPVTEADERAEAEILAALAALTPDLAVVSEEAHAQGRVPTIGRRFWLADALDGTREFVSGNGEFTVNIALIEDSEPTLGVVLAPALDRLYLAARGTGAFVEEGGVRRRLQCRKPPGEGFTVVSSRYHGDEAALEAFLAGHRVPAIARVGSSLKFCLVAAGQADLYPRMGRTMEWDTAAGQAVLAAAGGRVFELDGRELRYAKAEFVNPHFVAAGLAP